MEGGSSRILRSRGGDLRIGTTRGTIDFLNGQIAVLHSESDMHITSCLSGVVGRRHGNGRWCRRGGRRRERGRDRRGRQRRGCRRWGWSWCRGGLGDYRGRGIARSAANDDSEKQQRCGGRSGRQQRYGRRDKRLSLHRSPLPLGAHAERGTSITPPVKLSRRL